MRPSNMYDILIVSSRESEAACDWAKYFSECFKQFNKQMGSPIPKIYNLVLEDINGPEISGELHSDISNVKLQLIIVCPHFLEVIESRPEMFSGFGQLLKSDRIIAMLLGVTDKNLTEAHHKILTNYSQWQRHVIADDLEEKFAKEFFTAAVNIQTKIVRQEQRQAIEDRTSFSITPKKVKMSQNRLIILLSEPLNPDDKTKVTVDKNGELIEIKSVKRPNPYTLKFAMPKCCLEVSLIVKVLVEKNGDLLGMRPIKCENRLFELDQILRTTANPLEFMCQTLGSSLSSKEQLDNFLVHNFQKNLPPHFNLLSPKGQYFHPHQNLHSQEEFPTLLHFAAKYGFEKLTLQLLECPGADTAVEMKNVNDMTPSELAEKHGHNSLNSAFSGYMKMNEYNEFTEIYSTLHEMAKETENIGGELENEYLEPIKRENPYHIPPPARPVETSNFLPNQTNGYIDMISQGKGSVSKFRSNENVAQHELTEILTAFKQNITQVPEVENFVKMYNSVNTSDSLTKQEKLRYVHEEYEKMQEKLQATKKGQTPFERFKKLFQKNKKPIIDKSIEETSTVASSFDGSSSRRPISSLSIQSSISSASSGRMSTLSMGDSGTHSDNEDRKFHRSSVHDYLEIDENRLGHSNYMIPPAPRPIKIAVPQFTTINERPPQIIPRENGDPETDYILFPPSGLPVNGDEGKARARTPSPLPPPPDLPAEYLDIQDPPQEDLAEYINVSAPSKHDAYNDYGDDQVEYENTNQLPEYMNFKPQLPSRK